MNSVIDYMTRNKNKILVNVHPQIYKGVLVPEGTTPGYVLTVNNKSKWEPYKILNYADISNTWMNRQEYIIPPLVIDPYINYSKESKEVATAEVLYSLINNIYKIPGLSDILVYPEGLTGQSIQLTSSNKTATFSTNIVMDSTTFSRTGLSTTELYTLSALGISLTGQVLFDTPPRGIDPVLGTDVATKTYADTLIKDYSGNGINLYLNYPNRLSKTLGLDASVVTFVSSPTVIAEFITDSDYNAIPSGVWNMTLYGSILFDGMEIFSANVKYYFEIYKISEVTTLVETSNLSKYIESTTPDAYHMSATIVNHVSLQPSDRIAIKIYAAMDFNNGVEVTVNPRQFPSIPEVTTYFGAALSFVSTSLVNPPSTNVSILSMDNTFNKTNIFLYPIVADGITTTRVYAYEAGITTVETQGISSSQLQVTNLISNGISATTLTTDTIQSISGLTTTGITSTNIYSTNLHVSNLFYAGDLETTGLTATGISATNLRASVMDVGGLNTGGVTATGISTAQLRVSNLAYAEEIFTGGLTATGISTTNLRATQLVYAEGGLTTTGLTANGISATNLRTTELIYTGGIFTGGITATGISTTNMNVSSVFYADGITSTGISTTNLRITNLVYAGDVTTGGLTATDISTTKLQTTELIYAGNVNTTGLTATEISVTNLTTTTLDTPTVSQTTLAGNVTANNINTELPGASLYSTHPGKIKLGSATSTITIGNFNMSTIDCQSYDPINIGNQQTTGILNIGTNATRSGTITIGENGCPIYLKGNPTVNNLITAKGISSIADITTETFSAFSAKLKYLLVNNTLTCSQLIRPRNTANVNNSGFNSLFSQVNYFSFLLNTNSINSNVFMSSGTNFAKKGVWLYEITLNMPVGTIYNIKYSFSESSTEMGNNVFFMSSDDSNIKSNKFTMSLSTNKNIYLIYSSNSTLNTSITSIVIRVRYTRIV